MEPLRFLPKRPKDSSLDLKKKRCGKVWPQMGQNLQCRELLRGRLPSLWNQFYWSKCWQVPREMCKDPMEAAESIDVLQFWRLPWPG